MDNDLSPEQYGIIDGWLDANGYRSIAEWGYDSGYAEPIESHPGWADEHGNPVDLYEQAWYAYEAEQECIAEQQMGV